eukprot:COSAG04_NODE_1628_length_6114_cov_17.732502_7_plen_165_part_00
MHLSAHAERGKRSAERLAARGRQSGANPRRHAWNCLKQNRLPRQSCAFEPDISGEEKACWLAWGLYLLCVVVLRVGVEGGGDGDALEQALLVTLQRARRLHRPKRAPYAPNRDGVLVSAFGLAESRDAAGWLGCTWLQKVTAQNRDSTGGLVGCVPPGRRRSSE